MLPTTQFDTTIISSFVIFGTEYTIIPSYSNRTEASVLSMSGAKEIPRPQSKRPPDNPFTQQNLATCPPKEFFSPLTLAILTLVLGIILLPSGTTLLDDANDVYEKKITYDSGGGSLCAISSSNQGLECQVQFEFDETVDSPVYLYYELENYFQNHRRYLSSRSIGQLQGEDLAESAVKLDCTPLYLNGSDLLNPCGLIANSFFNDVFTVYSSSGVGVTLNETGIALPEDKDVLFDQVSGFQSTELTSAEATSAGCSEDSNYRPPTDPAVCDDFSLNTECLCYTDSNGQAYLFYYPSDDTTQYLYETYPNQISPINGVTDEHFIVWMRTAALPTFRKLYGMLHTVDGSSFTNGDIVTLTIVANFEVDSFDGVKTILVSSLGSLGGKNVFLGQAYITVGSFLLAAGVAILGWELWKMREDR